MSGYQKHILVPVLDRVDIHIEVPRVDYEKLSSDRMGETSEAIRARVQAARDIQRERCSNHGSDIICNADMGVGEIRHFCKLQDEGRISARVDHQILKLACTITDLAR